MHKTKLSRSATIKFREENSRECFDVYVFLRELHSLIKHPIILNYKSKITAARTAIGMTDYRFRKYIGIAVQEGLAYFEGDHLRFWSNNQDRSFKPARKNDYYETDIPKLESKLMLVHNHIIKQEAEIKAKERQTEYSVKNSVYTTKKSANYYTTLSTKSLKQILGVKSASIAQQFKKEITDRGLIKPQVRTHLLTKKEAALKLESGQFNIRKIRGSLYECFWFVQLNYNYKKVEHRPWMDLPEEQLNCYLEMGYSYEYIDSILG